MSIRGFLIPDQCSGCFSAAVVCLSEATGAAEGAGTAKLMKSCGVEVDDLETVVGARTGLSGVDLGRENNPVGGGGVGVGLQLTERNA